MYQFYMTQRPAMPGAQPKEGLVDIVGMNPKEVIPSIGKGAYALLSYSRPLTEQEIWDYELTPCRSEADIDAMLDEAYKGSWYTITGCGGDLDEWKAGYEGLLDQEGIGSILRWEQFTGADMNRKYHLTGDNRYPEDLHFLAFPLDGLNVGKLAMFKIAMQDRWFDDIVNNNRAREDENK